VSIDDLYAVAKPIMEKHGRPKDVHFAPEGYEVLAAAVAASIETALTNK
jgi:lysophospholipase L1-like esterase